MEGGVMRVIISLLQTVFSVPLGWLLHKYVKPMKEL
jgi:hypothetical protein